MKKYLSVAMLILMVASLHAMDHEQQELEESFVEVLKNKSPEFIASIGQVLIEAGTSTERLKELVTKNNCVWEVVAQELFLEAKNTVAVLKYRKPDAVSETLKTELTQNFLFEQFDNLDSLVQPFTEIASIMELSPMISPTTVVLFDVRDSLIRRNEDHTCLCEPKTPAIFKNLQKEGAHLYGLVKQSRAEKEQVFADFYMKRLYFSRTEKLLLNHNLEGKIIVGSDCAEGIFFCNGLNNAEKVLNRFYKTNADYFKEISKVIVVSDNSDTLASIQGQFLNSLPMESMAVLYHDESQDEVLLEISKIN